MAPFKARTIIETPLYLDGKTALGIECERLDEILDGILMKISVEPTRFPFAPGLEVRRARTQGFPPHIPSYRVWYTFDSQTVTLQLIEKELADERPIPESNR